MLRSLYSAIAALKNQETMSDVVAANIANVNTPGYKSERTVFAEMVTQAVRGATAPSASRGGINPIQIGLGSGVSEVVTSTSQGNIQQTGSPTDLAIQGSGYFLLEDASGANPVYTRAGGFDFDQNGDMVAPDGMYVMGRVNAAGGVATATDPIARINIPVTAQSFSIGQSGQVTYVDATGAIKNAGTLLLATFNNPAGLSKTGDSEFTQSSNSGTANLTFPTTNGAGNIQQGAVEMSNVDLASEFTGLIVAQRGFEANAKVISTSDQILQSLVNLKQ